MLVDSLELIDKSKNQLECKKLNQISRTQSREKHKEPTSMSFKDKGESIHPHIKDRAQRSRSVQLDSIDTKEAASSCYRKKKIIKILCPIKDEET